MKNIFFRALRIGLLTLPTAALAYPAGSTIVISTKGVEGTAVVVHGAKRDPASDRTDAAERSYGLHLKHWHDRCTGADLLFLCVGGTVIPRDPRLTP